MTTDQGTRPATLDRKAARRFVDAQVMPAAEAFDSAQAIPRQFLTTVAEFGAFGALIPTDYGGSGLDMVTVGALHEEFGRGCSSLRSLLTVHSMVAWAISSRGTDEQRATWLAPMAAGQVLAAFCLSEAAAGSDTQGIAATARQDGTDWIINGRKKWITAGMIAELYLIFARTEAGLAGFLVPRAAGVEAIAITDVLAPVPAC